MTVNLPWGSDARGEMCCGSCDHLHVCVLQLEQSHEW